MLSSNESSSKWEGKYVNLLEFYRLSGRLSEMIRNQNQLDFIRGDDPFMGKPMSSNSEIGFPSAGDEESVEDKIFFRNLLAFESDDDSDDDSGVNTFLNLTTISGQISKPLSGCTTPKPEPEIEEPKLDFVQNPPLVIVDPPVQSVVAILPIASETVKPNAVKISPKSFVILRKSPSIITSKIIPLEPKPIGLGILHDVITMNASNDQKMLKIEPKFNSQFGGGTFYGLKARRKRIRHPKLLKKNTPEYHRQRCKNNDSVRRSRAKKELINKQNELDLARLCDDYFLLTKRFNESQMDNNRLRSILDAHSIPY